MIGAACARPCGGCTHYQTNQPLRRSLAVAARRQPYNATILRVVGVRTATKLEKLSPAGYFGRPGIARVVTFVQHGNFIFLRLEIA